MNNERIMKVLLSPIITEKSAGLADAHRQFVFRVTTDATKPEIKAAVEKLFEVEVAKVQVANMKGKKKRFGAIHGRRVDWKKAYVTLKPGHDIDFMGQG
ncbi:MAG: 50S ribosomal protein L23 [Gammaproteobacteria bacterium]